MTDLIPATDNLKIIVNLTPWIVPRWAIRNFCDQVIIYHDYQYYVSQILEHNPDNYLVVTNGYHNEANDYLTQWLKDIWNVEEHE